MRQDKINIPSDWTTSLLDNITRRGSGHTPDKKVSSYWNGGIKWVSLADSSKLDDVFINNTDKEISDLGIKNSSAVMHKKGTVILSRDAGVGKSAILADDMAVSQHFIAWECSERNILDNLYLYYWLQMLKPEFERIAVGSTIKTIGLPYFKKFKIPHPELEEQKKISEIIYSSDIVIQNLEKLIAAKEKQKVYLEQKKFYELLDRSSVSFNKVFERITRKNCENQSKNVLTISAQLGLVSQVEYFNKSVSSMNISGYYLLRKGEFAYNKSYSSGYPMGAIKPLELYDEGVVSTLYICFKLKKETADNISFFKHYFESGAFNREISSIAQEGARNHGLLNVSVKDFFELKIPNPTSEEKRKLSLIFNNIDNEICLLKKKLALLRKQKKGLMQQLLTGAKRVK